MATDSSLALPARLLRAARRTNATTWIDYSGWLALCLMAFAPLIDIETSEEIRLSRQLIVKLLILLGSGIYCWWAFLESPTIRRVLSLFPPVAILALCGLLILASTQSPIPKESFVSAVSALVVIVLTLSVAVRMGPWRALYAIMVGQMLFVVGSWLAYWFVPEIGVFLEPIAGGEFYERMGGLAHPNTLGQFSTMAILITLLIVAAQKLPPAQLWRFAIPVLIVAGGALLMSASRSSMAACALAAVLGLRGWWLTGSRLGFILSGAFGTVLILFSLLATTAGEDFLQRQIFTKITKSGSTEELTTGTGRDEIWSATLRRIQDRPLLGYGCGVSKVLLRDSLGYAHNMFLHVALSGGLLAVLLLSSLLVVGLFNWVFRPDAVPDTLLWFLILNGLTENVIFENIASGATAILALSLSWRTLVQLQDRVEARLARRRV